MAVVSVAWADEETLNFSAQGYANQQEISTVEAENFSVTFNKGTNNNAPKYYTTGSAIRVYGGGYFTVSSDNTITGITLTFGSSDGSNAITTDVETYSNGTWSGSANSVTFNVGGTSGNRRIASITVTYTASGSSTTLEDNDLALTGAPVALTFDLYDNAEPQVINYTTSSTGAVTIPASNFFETAIDETNKTITVTPVAVTNGVKEATVNQAADDTYKAGSATFTVDITDSTPFAGGDVTFVCGTDVSETTSLTKNNVTMEFESGGGVWNRTDNYRLYSGKTLTISTSVGTITKIVFSVSQNNFSGEGYNKDTKTWTGDATSITLTTDGGQVRFTPVAVTVTMPGDDPYISANNVNITYDATSGEIAYTINNPVPGTLLQATADADCVSDITVGDEAITFTTTANEANTERVATFTLTYEGAEDKTVTVTQAAAPVVYTTIPDLFAAATSTSTPVAITFNNWVISAVKGSNAYLTDNAGNGLIIYQSGHDFNVNDVLSGTASCNLVTYQGSAELTALTASTEGLTVTAGGTVTEQNIAINELGGVNTGALLAYENLTYNGTALVDADNNAIEPYSTLYSYTFEADKVYNVKGIYKQYTTNTQDKKQILPRSADDIEEVVSEDPAVTLENYNIDVPVEGGDGILTVQYQNIDDVTADIQFYGEDGSEVDANYYEDWLTAELDEDNNVSYIAIENNGEERKAYFKVYALVGDNSVYSEVYSDMITITQEGFSAIRNFTFEQTSATAGTLTNEPEGVTAVFNNTYTNNKEQLTKENSMTLTIKGMPANYKVTGITLTVKNNASKGSGTATVSIGKKEIGTLDVTGLGGTYGDQDVTIIPSFATSDLVINIAATENSVYCKKFTIEYEIMDYVGVTIKEGFTATTFSCDKALDFSAVEGITANIITDENGLTKPVEKVPAGKGLYIVGAEGDYEVPFLADETKAEDVSANKLIPTDGTTKFKSDESTTYYVFGKQNGKEAFYKVPTSGYTPSANKAVLVVNAPESSAKEMIVIGGDVTGIESVENGTIVNDNYYTIDGKLVKGQPTQKGIYVVNGRKVVIK